MPMKERTRNLLAFAAGVATGAALPVVVPAVAEAGRPLVKALVKHGILGFDRMRTGLARAAETVEDLVAEARADAAGVMAPATVPPGVEPEPPVHSEPVAESAPVRPNLKVMS